MENETGIQFVFVLLRMYIPFHAPPPENQSGKSVLEIVWVPITIQRFRGEFPPCGLYRVIKTGLGGGLATVMVAYRDEAHLLKSRELSKGKLLKPSVPGVQTTELASANGLQAGTTGGVGVGIGGGTIDDAVRLTPLDIILLRLRWPLVDTGSGMVKGLSPIM